MRRRPQAIDRGVRCERGRGIVPGVLLPSRNPGRHAAAPGAAVRAWTELTRLVLPVTCAGCGVEDVPLCGPCRATLPTGAALVRDLTAAGAPRVWSAGAYDGPLQRLLVQVKDEGRHDLVPVVAGCAAHAARTALGAWWGTGRQEVVLVPVPSSRAAVRRRGVDVVTQTARRVAVTLRRRGMPVVTLPALQQRRGVRDQATLDVAARADNVAAALRVRRGAPVAGRVVLLLDDVVTTGATLAAACAALEASGARVHGAATVAATPRRLPHG